jgi:hypothetical protein
MLDPNKNYKAELMKLVTEFSKKENWVISKDVNDLKVFTWVGEFDPVNVAEDLIQEIITPPPRGNISDTPDDVA